MSVDRAKPDPLPVWATPWGYAVLVTLLSLPRLIVASRMGLLSDEAYYALWSMHLSAGYFDHSPGIAYAVALGRALFGEGIFPVRAITLALGFFALAALYRLGTLLFADPRSGALAGFFYAVSVGAVLSFSIATPDGISTVFWLLALWAVAEFAARGNANWWLAAGGLAGLGLLSKYTNLFLAPGLLLYLLVNRDRRSWLAHWQVWAGALLALLLFLPVVWWNATNGWMSFRFQFGRSSFTGGEGVTSAIPFLYYWAALALILLPPAFLLIVAAFPAWIGGRARGLDLPFWTSLPMVGFFALHSLVNTANPNWLDPVFPPLMLAAARSTLHAAPRLVAALLKYAQIALGLLAIAVLGGAVLAGEMPGYGMRGVFSYGRGWDRMARELSVMAAENGARYVDARTYLVSSLVAYAMHTNGDPLPVLQTSEPFRYSYDPPAPELVAEPHLLLRETRGDAALPPIDANAVSLGLVMRTDGPFVLGKYSVDLVR